MVSIEQLLLSIGNLTVVNVVFLGDASYKRPRGAKTVVAVFCILKVYCSSYNEFLSKKKIGKLYSHALDAPAF